MPPAAAVLTETLSRCPICGSPERQRFCDGKDRLLALTGERFSYQQCGGCGVLYQSPRPSEQAIGRYYPSDNYHPYTTKATLLPAAEPVRAAKPDPAPEIPAVLPQAAPTPEPSGAAANPAPAPQPEPKPTPAAGAKPKSGSKGKSKSKSKSKTLAKRKPAPAVKKKPEPPLSWHVRLQQLCRQREVFGDLLDFGCGSPAFLDQARLWGWNTHGTDFNPSVVERITAAGHCGWPLEEITGGTGERFDFIRLSHVVEHLFDPRGTLRQLISRLRPGGRMHLATPNGGSWSASLFRSCWLGLDCPRHIVIFTPETLRALLQELGCDEVEVFYESKPADLRRSVVYFLGELGLTRVLGGEMGVNSPFDPVLSLPGKWSTAAGKSGRFHIFARKAPAAA